MEWGKFRPQIALAVICATVFSCAALYVGLQMAATEIVTGVIGESSGSSEESH